MIAGSSLYGRCVGSVARAVGADRVSSAVRSVSTIADPDYVDEFTLVAVGVAEASAEEWARAALEDAPLSDRAARRAWSILGLRLGPPGSPEHVQGWRIGAKARDWIRLETSSWYLRAEAMCVVQDHTVSLSLALEYEQPVAAPVWALVSRPHQRAVPVMLRQAAGVIDARRRA